MTKKIGEGNKRGGANAEIIAGLTKFARKYELEKNRGKAMAYRRAILTIQGITQPIRDVNELKCLQGLGASIITKIGEFFRKGRFSDAQDPFDPEKMAGIEELKGIHGVGDAVASTLYDKGYKSVKDIREKQGGIELTPIQRIGLKYYEEFIEKIPRDEVSQIAKQIKRSCRELFDGEVKVTTCGSYRRGRSECGDVDILLTTKDPNGKVADILPKLTRHLEKQRFLKEKLQAISAFKTGSYTYMGVCKPVGENTKHRRIDIKAYPAYQYGYAIMYFTGSF